MHGVIESENVNKDLKEVLSADKTVLKLREEKVIDQEKGESEP